MDYGMTGQISYLDGVMQREGSEKCISAFTGIYRKKGPGAVALLNDRRLTFACFYILLPRIREYKLINYLNSRNIMALRIVNQILHTRNSGSGTDYLSSKKNRVYSALKWILETGAVLDGYDDNYEEIMDVSVSVLLGTYKEKSIMPLVADMIFKRGRQGHYIHDLVWAFFRIEDPQTLRLIAEYLKSHDAEDEKLACELLNLNEPYIETADSGKKEARYRSYMQWLEENDPFLYFTHDGYQLESKPTFCAVDMERKYLNKGLSTRNRQPLLPADELEDKCLRAFKALSYEDKKLLSDYSRKVHKRDSAWWRSWLNTPVNEQLEGAKREKGGLL